MDVKECVKRKLAHRYCALCGRKVEGRMYYCEEKQNAMDVGRLKPELE